MSATAISAMRLVWPRHTAKHMSRKWGRAVVTAKSWLRCGIPEYQLHTILADLDTELEKMETELVTVRAELRRALLEQQNSIARRAAGAGHGEGSAGHNQAAPR